VGSFRPGIVHKESENQARGWHSCSAHLTSRHQFL